MRCPIETRENAEVLLAYCARKLDAETSAILEGHIGTCPACREFAGGQQAVWQALDAWEAAPVSADFDRRLYQRIEQEVSWWDRLMRPFRPLLFRQGLPIAAAAGLVIVAGLMLERPAAVPPANSPVSAQVEVPPDQAEHALQEMEMMREFNRLVHADAADPKM
jgi:anti-sigma factor RsiW